MSVPDRFRALLLASNDHPVLISPIISFIHFDALRKNCFVLWLIAFLPLVTCWIGSLEIFVIGLRVKRILLSICSYFYGNNELLAISFKTQ